MGIARLKGHAGGKKTGHQKLEIGQGKGLILDQQAEKGHTGLASIEAIGDADHAIAGSDGLHAERAAGFRETNHIGHRRDVTLQAIVIDDAARAENGCAGHDCLRFWGGRIGQVAGVGDKVGGLVHREVRIFPGAQLLDRSLQLTLLQDWFCDHRVAVPLVIPWDHFGALAIAAAGHRGGPRRFLSPMAVALWRLRAIWR